MALFFLEGTQPREEGVDICATALGIVSSSNFINENVNDEISNAVYGGISTLYLLGMQTVHGHQKYLW